MQTTLTTPHGTLSLEKPIIMGILNITPDSFYDGGRYNTEQAILQRVEQIINEGGDIVDLGAVSTRPGAIDIPEEEEIAIIQQNVKLIRKHFPNVVISIDTWRASVAQHAIEEGADIINDISGGTFDDNMIPIIGQYQVPYCLMHTPAKPDTMQQHTHYEDIMKDIFDFFNQQIEKLHHVNAHQIILDPGFGFGKTIQQNYDIFKNLDQFLAFNLPILVGISRKSMIYKLLDTTPQGALNGTTVLNTIALSKGAHILRVHDVKEADETRKILMQF